MIKHCSICKTNKPVEEYSSNRRNKDGLAVYCRPCNSAKQREWKHANPEKIKEWKRRYNQKIRTQNETNI